MLRPYKYRLLPTEAQKKTLISWMGSCRFVYNLGLEVKTRAWATAQKNVSCYDLIKQLTQLKRHEAPWLAECSAQSLESAITNLEKAYNNFFRGGGFPKFKKKSNTQSIQFRQDSKVKDGKISFTKIGWVNFIEHRPLGKGEIRTVTVSKTPSNDWYVSILVKDEKELPKKAPIASETTVGVDMGISSFATLSDGQKIENPRFLQQELNRLKREQRTLSRRFKKGVPLDQQSKGWHKQRLVVAKLQEHIANKRKDFLHKTSTAIIKQYDTICLEDLNIVGMMQNRSLSKAISDVSWYQFRIFLEYKAEWCGKNILFVGRFTPSSRICSNCGHSFKELKLSDREWDCEKCGVHHDRDINAAINIKSLGLRKQPKSANAGQ